MEKKKRKKDNQREEIELMKNVFDTSGEFGVEFKDQKQFLNEERIPSEITKNESIKDKHLKQNEEQQEESDKASQTQVIPVFSAFETRKSVKKKRVHLEDSEEGNEAREEIHVVRCAGCNFRVFERDKFCGRCGAKLKPGTGEIEFCMSVEEEARELEVRNLMIEGILSANSTEVVMEKRKIMMPENSPQGLFTVADEAKLWLIGEFPPESTSDTSFAESVILQCSVGIALLLGRAPNQLGGSKISTFLPLERVNSEHYRNATKQWYSILDDYADGSVSALITTVYCDTKGNLYGIVWKCYLFMRKKVIGRSFNYIKYFWRISSNSAVDAQKIVGSQIKIVKGEDPTEGATKIQEMKEEDKH